MQLFNLKDHNEAVSFAQAVRQGIGHDQGLFFMDHIEPLAHVEELLKLSLVERSKLILRHLIGKEELPELESIVESAFTFRAPLVKADERSYCLELFHGPTLAFKDFGARFMARVLSAVNQEGRLTILTATSGDTGAAVADAFYGQSNIDVVILYPLGKISSLQEKLIATLGGNIRAVQVDDTFDACQDLVKQAFEDRTFVNKVGLNSANSINISRLLAQVCYYFEAVAQLPEEKRQAVVFSVPCGNFGNITAGLIAKSLGLKARFVVACNANDTVPRYLKSGKWEPHATIPTLSNAMDISRPNNWPRVEALFKMQGWDLSELSYGSLDDEATRAAMRELYAKEGYIAEPHAAIAWKVLSDSLREGETGIFLGTAHPAKFKDTVDHTLNLHLPLPDVLARKAQLPSKAELIDADYGTLKELMLG